MLRHAHCDIETGGGVTYFRVHRVDGSHQDVQAQHVVQIGDRVVFRQPVECMRTVFEVPIGDVTDVRRRIVEHDETTRWICERYPVAAEGEGR
jgi:hypothetical protein